MHALSTTYYLKSVHFQNASQFAFTENQPTEDALINFISKIYNSINNNCKTTAVFIDCKKAFDLVNHKILLQKLESADVRGTAFKWFESFLVGRSQTVKVNNQLIPPLTIKLEVTQGSVLSSD